MLKRHMVSFVLVFFLYSYKGDRGMSDVAVVLF